MTLGTEVHGELPALYEYPNDSYSPAEGKSAYDLELEIMAGGPHPESRIGRTYSLAENPEHPLHFVAKYYLYLKWQQAKNWVLEPGQSLMPLPEGCAPISARDDQPKAIPVI